MSDERHDEALRKLADAQVAAARLQSQNQALQEALKDSAAQAEAFVKEFPDELPHPGYVRAHFTAIANRCRNVLSPTQETDPE